MNSIQNKPAKPFQPTEEMIAAAETAFVAMAFEQTVRPIVEGYQRKILTDRAWHESDEVQASRRRIDDTPFETRITDIKYTWLMSNEDFAVYHQLCDQARIAANLRIEIPGHCPLLDAQEATRQALRDLCNVMAPVSGISADMLDTMRMEHYHQYVEITLSLMGQFVGKPNLTSKA